MESRFLDVRPNLVGTCEWLFDTPEYKQWQDPSMMSEHHGILWIRGKAGTGKSTLMKYIAEIAEARSLEDEHISSLFFNARGEPVETSLDGLLRTMLHQILKKITGLFDLLDGRRFRIARRQGWSSTLLRDVFRDAIMHLGPDRVTCYVDATDECYDGNIEDLIRFFDDLGDSSVEQAKRFYVCLSSRHYLNIRISRSIGLVLERQQGHDSDIRTYIHKRLIVDNESLKQGLARTIEEKASGLFLWVVLVVELLNRDDRRGNAHEIHERVDHIPGELSDLFDQSLTQGPFNKYLLSLLVWVTFSWRRVSRTELHRALLHEAEITMKSTWAPDTATKEKFLMESSKGLVEVNQGRHSSRVQFIHESVRTYFLDRGLNHFTEDIEPNTSAVMETGIDFRGSTHSLTRFAHCHDRLKATCLSYVMTLVWKEISASAPLSGKFMRYQLKGSYPFFPYANRGVLKHAEETHKHGLSQQIFLDALPSKEIGILLHSFEPEFIGVGVPVETAPWYTACLLVTNRCPELLKVVLETLRSIDVAPWQWGAILAASITNNAADYISTIVRAGADSNAPVTQDGPSCLSFAIDKSRLQCVERLLACGAKPHAIDSKADDCLWKVCKRGDLDCANLLLGKHSEAYTHSPEFRMSLARAFGNADSQYRQAMALLFLEKGAQAKFWSYAASTEPYCIDVTFQDISIMRVVVAERSEDSTFDDSITDLTLRFTLNRPMEHVFFFGLNPNR